MSDIRKAIMARLGEFVRPGAKAKFGGSGIVVKEDAQYIYYYPEEDDRATFADADGKGAYTVKSNRTGKPVSAKTYRSWDEANSASNAMNEKLPPLKKRKGFSRPGAKAMFGSKRTTAGALRKQLKAQGITDTADLEWHGISASDPDNTPYWLHEDGSMEKIKASRLGAKAEMAQVISQEQRKKWEEEVEALEESLKDATWAMQDARRQGLTGVAEKAAQKAQDIRRKISQIKEALRFYLARPGAKSKMGRAEDIYRKLASGSVTYANAKEMEQLASEALRLPDFTPAGTDWSLHELAEEMGQEVLALKSRASRRGAKATAAKPEVEETEEQKAGLKLMEKADKAVSDKIRTLIKEGKPQDQAVAIALDMKRRGEI